MERATIKKRLKRELSSRRKYKTTYKDIKYYFNMINKAVFKNKLAPFNDITGNHNKLFYSFRPKLNAIGLDL